MPAIRISVQSAPFDIADELARIRTAGGSVGALVTFTGVCRDEGGRLVALELEHYPGMAEEEIGRIVDEAASRWPLSAISVVHRYGRIVSGDEIVLVITASAHRDAAFEAARFLMDFMKTSAPFWKKEHLVGSEAGGWVAPRNADDDALQRWRK